MTGVFPSVLKTAKVVPVLKKDSKLDYSNLLLKKYIYITENIRKALDD